MSRFAPPQDWGKRGGGGGRERSGNTEGRGGGGLKRGVDKYNGFPKEEEAAIRRQQNNRSFFGDTIEEMHHEPRRRDLIARGFEQPDIRTVGLGLSQPEHLAFHHIEAEIDGRDPAKDPDCISLTSRMSDRLSLTEMDRGMDRFEQLTEDPKYSNRIREEIIRRRKKFGLPVGRKNGRR